MDGTANARTIIKITRHAARKAGVRFLQAEAKDLCINKGNVASVELLVGDGSDDSVLQQLNADRVSDDDHLVQESGTDFGSRSP